jgi:hypothetical protein
VFFLDFSRVTLLLLARELNHRGKGARCLLERLGDDSSEKSDGSGDDDDLRWSPATMTVSQRLLGD